MKKKVLMWRGHGDTETEWEEYIKAGKLDEYEVNKIYIFEYKVVEVEGE